MEKIKCPKCGQEITKSAPFCVYCGEKINRKGNDIVIAERGKESLKKEKVLLGLCAFGVALGIIFIVFICLFYRYLDTLLSIFGGLVSLALISLCIADFIFHLMDLKEKVRNNSLSSPVIIYHKKEDLFQINNLNNSVLYIENSKIKKIAYSKITVFYAENDEGRLVPIYAKYIDNPKEFIIIFSAYAHCLKPNL